jgi:hypothetical protein
MSNKKLDLEGLQQQLSSIREDVCITAVTAAKDLCEKLGIRVEGRIRRRKQMPGENARDAGLSAVEEITRTSLYKPLRVQTPDRLIFSMVTCYARVYFSRIRALHGTGNGPSRL